MKALRWLLSRMRGRRPRQTATMEALTYMVFHGAPTRGVIHVGANDAAEFDDYVRFGVGTVLWIEPLPDVFQTLQRKISSQPGHRAVNTACSDDDDVSVDLNVASNRGESSSLFKPSLHAALFPDVLFNETLTIKTAKLDTVIRNNNLTLSDYNLLVIDTQGAELLVLRGAADVLSEVTAVYTEVSEVPLYEGSCTWPDIHAYLLERGFSLKHLHIGQHYFGNAFYIKNPGAMSGLG